MESRQVEKNWEEFERLVKVAFKAIPMPIQLNSFWHQLGSVRWERRALICLRDGQIERYLKTCCWSSGRNVWRGEAAKSLQVFVFSKACEYSSSALWIYTISSLRKAFRANFNKAIFNKKNFKWRASFINERRWCFIKSRYKMLSRDRSRDE